MAKGRKKRAKEKTPRRRAPSTREKILLLAQREVLGRDGQPRDITRKVLAKRLGISVRTLARRLAGSEGRTDTPKAKRAAARLKREYEKERREIDNARRRERRKHPKAVRAAKLPYRLRGSRRQIKERKIDRKTGAARETGRTIESSWTQYSVKGFSFQEVLNLLIALWRDGRVVQLIFEIPAGARYPVGRDGKRPGLKTRKRTRSGTAPEALWLMESEDEVLNFLAGVMPMEPSARGLKMLYVAVDDNKPRRK